MTDDRPPWPDMGPSWDRDGNPISFEEWARIIEDDRGHGSYGIVGQTTIGEGVADVSTVWIGLNLTIGVRPPVIFETMIFAEGMECDGDCQRAATYPEAYVNHGMHIGRVLMELGVPLQPAMDAGVFAIVNDAETLTTAPDGTVVAWTKRERTIPRPLGA
jgi:hypothetical protein